MKPANLRKRGGKSRSVHTLADKVQEYKKPFHARDAAGVCFVGKMAQWNGRRQEKRQPTGQTW